MPIAFENTVFLLVPKENASVLVNREKLVRHFKTEPRLLIYSQFIFSDRDVYIVIALCSIDIATELGNSSILYRDK
jgi:hypothetical protein